MILNSLQGVLGRILYPNTIWRGNSTSKQLFLTFDDGPTPGVTDWVLEQLSLYNAKSTFFCLGKNAGNHPELFQKIQSEGHCIGNHTNDHLNGWNTSLSDYLANIELAEKFISSSYFRPPYGRFKPSQRRAISKKYMNVMWDVLSMDYNVNLNYKDCIETTLKQTRPGSILVFHDSVKAWPRLERLLPFILKYYASKGYTFITLDEIQN